MRKPRLFTLLLAALFTQACSETSSGPQKGTPAFSWNAALETFSKADNTKTADHLDALLKSDNEYTSRALPWRLILLSGELKGLSEMADKFEYGARANKSNPAPFRKVVNDTRSMAGQTASRLAELWPKFKPGAEGVALEFPFPAGTSAQSPSLNNAANGIMQSPGEVENTRNLSRQRGLLLALTRAVGAGDDVAKAREILKTGSAKVPAEIFSEAMAEALFDAATLFSKSKLDRPDSMKLLSNQAMEILKTLPSNKDRKALADKIQDSLKKKT